MDLAKMIADGIATANRMTQSLQPTVEIRRWTGVKSGSGEAFPPDVVRVRALVEKRQQLIARPGGTEARSRNYLAILEQIPPVSPPVTDRDEPIDERDIIVLPDGDTGPILAVTGLVNPTTERPFLAEVWLG